jgi:hypothetical protein
LEVLVDQEAARIAGGLDHDKYLVVSGRIQSLETVYSLIDTLDKTAREIDEHRSKSGDAKRDADTRRDLNFAGSPYWAVVRGTK